MKLTAVFGHWICCDDKPRHVCLFNRCLCNLWGLKQLAVLQTGAPGETLSPLARTKRRTECNRYAACACACVGSFGENCTAHLPLFGVEHPHNRLDTVWMGYLGELFLNKSPVHVYDVIFLPSKVTLKCVDTWWMSSLEPYSSWMLWLLRRMAGLSFLRKYRTVAHETAEQKRAKCRL
jgi:hypothetical protein